MALIGLLLATLGSVMAQDLSEPRQVVRATLARHPAVKKAEDLVRAANFGLRGSRLQPNPQLTLAATTGDAGESANSLTQTFEISGQPHLRWSVATARLRASEKNRRAVRRRIAAQTYRAWLTLWKTARLMELAELRITLMQETVKAAQRRFEVGEIAQNEALRVELAAAQAEAETEQARASLESARRDLGLLLGQELEGLPLEGEPDSLLLAKWTLPEVLQAVEDHPQVLAQRQQQSALEYQADLAGKERAPVLGVTAYRSRLTGTGTVEQGAQLYLSWPLFDWGRIANEQHRRQAQAQAYAAGLEELILERRREVSQLWFQLQAARTNRRIFAGQSSRYQELAREARVAYDLGMLSLTDVFATEASFRNAGGQLIEAQARVLELEVRLLEETGLPWPDGFIEEVL